MHSSSVLQCVLFDGLRWGAGQLGVRLFRARSLWSCQLTWAVVVVCWVLLDLMGYLSFLEVTWSVTTC